MVVFDAVLLDRDGTLIRDVPYNGDPQAVQPMPGARAALDRLRAAGLPLAVVSNQSGVAKGLLTIDAVESVNRRVEELLGPFDAWRMCLHDTGDACRCRKPAPGLVHAAAAALGVAAHRCVMIGDIGSDVAAAEAAGATGVMVPTALTKPDEIARASVVRPSLSEAVGWILAAQQLLTGPPEPARRGAHVLAVRADSAGDMLQTGPALRAIAARAGSVTVLAGPLGRAAAAMLPGVSRVLCWRTPWIDADPLPVQRDDVITLVDQIAAGGYDEAIIFTSFHQSPLPFALLMRLAGVATVGAISDDYPGSLLDLRHRVPGDLPEPQRALSLAAAAGYPLPAGDDGRLRTTIPAATPRRARRVILHPGARADARALPAAASRQIAVALAGLGHEVMVTGAAGERELTAYVAAGVAADLGGRTSLAELGGLIGTAGCLVVGNTGPAHLAAAMETPVVSLFAPTVSWAQWGPYRTPRVRLGDPLAPCRDTRLRTCDSPAHPCLGRVNTQTVIDAVNLLIGSVQ